MEDWNKAENKYYAEVQATLQEQIQKLEKQHDQVVKTTKELSEKSEHKFQVQMKRIQNQSDRALSNASDMATKEERLAEKIEQRGQVLFQLELELNKHTSELKQAEK